MGNEAKISVPREARHREDRLPWNIEPPAPVPVRMKRWVVVILLSLGAGFWLGRQSIGEIREAFFPATPRDAYVHRLESSGLGQSALARQWAVAGEAALRNAPLVEDPFREAGYLDPASPGAVGYRFLARAGQEVTLDVRLEPPNNTLLFLDLFRAAERAGDPPVHVTSADSGTTTITFEPRRDGEYIVRVQPELLRGGRYTLSASVVPTLAFPVSGAGVGNIQSFWGAPRDGGAREHHGVDIFAPRGTPVVAATDGRVSSVRSTPRGGNVVWLRDERRGQSLYYAHLDRQLVERGAVVRQGDTLGLVGNTGNARSTPPHLHFGIYRRGSGPVDPLPFVEPPPGPPRDPSVPLDELGGWRRTAAGVPLRVGPSEAAGALARLEERVPVRVLAAIGDWYRVVAPDGRAGYIPGARTEPLDALRTAAVADSAALLDRPGGRGAEIARLAPGAEVRVLGTAAEHLYVEADGRRAWLARGAAP